MAFTDPQSVTVNSVAKSMPRVSTGDLNSVYKSADDAWQFRISHQKSKSRIRRMVRLDNKLVAADPLTAENTYQSVGVYLVIDEPDVGVDDTTIGYQVAALTAWATPTNVGNWLPSRNM